jgi:hypothetical protein
VLGAGALLALLIPRLRREPAEVVAAAEASQPAYAEAA